MHPRKRGCHALVATVDPWHAAEMADTLLDLKGLKCPLPALKTRKALDRLQRGEVLEVTVTDPMAAIDIPHLVRQTGDELTHQHAAGGHLVFRIRKA